MKYLTPNELRFLVYLENKSDEADTTRKMAEAFGVGSNRSVFLYLKQLREKNIIDVKSNGNKRKYIIKVSSLNYMILLYTDAIVKEKKKMDRVHAESIVKIRELVKKRDEELKLCK